MITTSVVNEAIGKLLPPKALKAMGIDLNASPAKHPKDASPFSLSFQCPDCSHIQHEKRPEVCPICSAGGETFTVLDVGEADSEAKDSVEVTAFDGHQLKWTKEALEELEQIPEELAREQIRLKLEKQTRTRKQTVITKEMVTAALS